MNIIVRATNYLYIHYIHNLSTGYLRKLKNFLCVQITKCFEVFKNPVCNMYT